MGRRSSLACDGVRVTATCRRPPQSSLASVFRPLGSTTCTSALWNEAPAAVVEMGQVRFEVSRNGHTSFAVFLERLGRRESDDLIRRTALRGQLRFSCCRSLRHPRQLSVASKHSAAYFDSA